MESLPPLKIPIPTPAPAKFHLLGRQTRLAQDVRSGKYWPDTLKIQSCNGSFYIALHYLAD